MQQGTTVGNSGRNDLLDLRAGLGMNALAMGGLVMLEVDAVGASEAVDWEETLWRDSVAHWNRHPAYEARASVAHKSVSGVVRSPSWIHPGLRTDDILICSRVTPVFGHASSRDQASDRVAGEDHLESLVRGREECGDRVVKRLCSFVIGRGYAFLMAAESFAAGPAGYEDWMRLYARTCSPDMC